MKRLLLVSLICVGALAQTLDSFAALTGRWEGEGTFLGAKATASYEWERTLGGRAVTLRYQVRRGGKTVFEGHGYYRADGSGAWHDSEGNDYAVTWKATEQGVASTWGEGGSSEYGAERVTDRMKGKVFATFSLRRRD
jgi:hypothetical protein